MGRWGILESLHLYFAVGNILVLGFPSDAEKGRDAKLQNENIGVFEPVGNRCLSNFLWYYPIKRLCLSRYSPLHRARAGVHQLYLRIIFRYSSFP